jgi:hypothetical protein
MIAYSAAQALSPAIERTKRYLFQPFRWGRFLKLTLVALLTEGGVSSCNFGSKIPSGNGGGGQHVPFHMPMLHWPAVPMLIAFAAVVMLIVIPVGLFLSYLLIRLRFSYFDCVMRQIDRIGPAWSIYHRQALRYLGMMIWVGVAFWMVIAVIGYWSYVRFRPLFDSMGPGHPFHISEFLPLIAVAIPMVLLLAFGGSVIDAVLSYFVLPRMALEDASIGDALSDVWADILLEPWQYVFFLVLKYLATLAATIVGCIALLIPFAILFGIGVACVLLLKSASMPLALLLGIPAGVLLVGAFVLAGIGLSGMIGTFRRNYALMFYGGRYALLGAILEPQMPPPLPAWQPAMPPRPM